MGVSNAVRMAGVAVVLYLATAGSPVVIAENPGTTVSVQRAAATKAGSATVCSADE